MLGFGGERAVRAVPQSQRNQYEDLSSSLLGVPSDPLCGEQVAHNDLCRKRLPYITCWSASVAEISIKQKAIRENVYILYSLSK